MDGRLRPLLIGQAPGPNTNPHLPLYPHPKTSTGGRLLELTGLNRGQYLRTFQRTNLLHEFPGSAGRAGKPRVDRFPMREARAAAAAMTPLLDGRLVVLVGRNVARAFDQHDLPWHHWHEVVVPFVPAVKFALAVVPHASGLCRWYNEPSNRQVAEHFWRQLVEAVQNREVA